MKLLFVLLVVSGSVAPLKLPDSLKPGTITTQTEKTTEAEKTIEGGSTTVKNKVSDPNIKLTFSEWATIFREINDLQVFNT